MVPSPGYVWAKAPAAPNPSAVRTVAECKIVLIRCVPIVSQNWSAAALPLPARMGNAGDEGGVVETRAIFERVVKLEAG